MNVHVCYYGINPVLKAMLRNYDYIDLEQNPDYQFIPGHRYLIFDKDAYDVIVNHQGIHLGPRREGFYEMTKMDYLLTQNGVIFKFRYVNYERRTEWLTKESYDKMLPNIENIRKKLKGAELKEIVSKKNGNTYWLLEFRDLAELDKDVLRFLIDENYVIDPPTVSYYKIIRDKEDLINSFDYFINQDKGRRFGFDYETCGGFPFDSPHFSPMGLGIADLDGNCAYFDIEYIRDNTDYYQLFIDKLIEFLRKHGDQCYTYNVGFELRVTYLLTKDMYPLQDSATINKLEGDVDYNMSLKYTAMRHCKVASWDDDFELMQELLSHIMNNPDMFDPDMYNPEWPTYTLDNYTECPEWKEMNELFPGNEQEFHRLVKKYWGDIFGGIPSEILGKYCCRDAYYTLLLRLKSDEIGYTDDAWNCFNSNLRLGAHLNMNGAYIDEDYRRWMHKVGHNICAYGALNMSKVYVKMEMEKLGDFEMVEIPEITNMLKKGLDFTNSKEFLKFFLDENYETGINMELAYEIMGPELTELVIEIIKQYYDKLEYGCFRTRKVFNHIDEVLRERWNYELGTNSIKVNFNQQSYEIKSDFQNIIYEYQLLDNQKLINHYLSQLDPEKPVSTVTNLKGETVTTEELESYANSVFNMNSPVEIKAFLCHYLQRMRRVIYMCKDEAAVFEHIKDGVVVDRTPEQWAELYTTAPNLKCERTMHYIYKKYEQVLRNVPELEAAIIEFDKYHNYLLLLFKLTQGGNFDAFARDLEQAYGLTREIKEDKRKLDEEGMTLLLWSFETDESNWILSGLMWGIFLECEDSELVDWYYDNLTSFDIEEVSLQGLAKLAYCYKATRKYNKVLTTYIDGMLVDTARHAAEYDEFGMCPQRWDGAGTAWKAYPRFDVCQKKSKRWASNWHTIPSKDECKRVVTTPPGFLMSYFDISGMEVRTLAYLAQDKFMLEQYAKGVDPYVEAGKLMEPGHEEDYYWAMRPDLKTMLLGSLYGMGIQMLAERMNLTVEQAEERHTKMFQLMADIDVFIKHKADYVFAHDGRVETILGDKLMINNEPEDRWARLGNNLCIQGGSAVLMADAFENIIQHSMTDKDIIIRPLIVVHDSSQNYFETKKIFEINDYYTKYLTDYLYDKYKIRYEFDTLVGVNYFDMCEVKVIDADTIQLTGNYRSLTKLAKKLEADGVEFDIISIKHKKKDIEYFENGVLSPEFAPKCYKSMVRAFYEEGLKSVYEIDNSKYRMTIRKRNGNN